MHQPIEELDVYKKTCELADEIFRLVVSWPHFQKSTIGSQLCRAIDSVGANLVEGDGRESQREGLRFFDIARGSSRETQYWIERATVRELLSSETATRLKAESVTVGRMITRLIQYRKRTLNANMVRENESIYDTHQSA